MNLVSVNIYLVKYVIKTKGSVNICNVSEHLANHTECGGG